MFYICLRVSYGYWSTESCSVFMSLLYSGFPTETFAALQLTQTWINNNEHNFLCSVCFENLQEIWSAFKNYILQYLLHVLYSIARQRFFHAILPNIKFFSFFFLSCPIIFLVLFCFFFSREPFLNLCLRVFIEMFF